jgi:hypothetical protein
MYSKYFSFSLNASPAGRFYRHDGSFLFEESWSFLRALAAGIITDSDFRIDEANAYLSGCAVQNTNIRWVSVHNKERGWKIRQDGFIR